MDPRPRGLWIVWGAVRRKIPFRSLEEMGFAVRRHGAFAWGIRGLILIIHMLLLELRVSKMKKRERDGGNGGRERER